MNGTPTPTGRPTDAGRSTGSNERPALFDSARRRALVRVLTDRDAVVELDELARGVAAEEYDLHPDEIDEETYERVLVTLHETHLPLLADAGVATVDRSDGVFVRPNREALAAL